MVRLYCDRGARRADALLLQLPASGATLTLGDAIGDVFETVAYSRQTPGVSMGRLPRRLRRLGLPGLSQPGTA